MLLHDFKHFPLPFYFLVSSASVTDSPYHHLGTTWDDLVHPLICFPLWYLHHWNLAIRDIFSYARTLCQYHVHVPSKNEEFCGLIEDRVKKNKRIKYKKKMKTQIK